MAVLGGDGRCRCSPASCCQRARPSRRAQPPNARDARLRIRRLRRAGGRVSAQALLGHRRAPWLDGQPAWAPDPRSAASWRAVVFCSSAMAPGWPGPGHGVSSSKSRASVRAWTAWHSLGANSMSRPLLPLMLSPVVVVISTSPSSTVTQARRAPGDRRGSTRANQQRDRARIVGRGEDLRGVWFEVEVLDRPAVHWFSLWRSGQIDWR